MKKIVFMAAVLVCISFTHKAFAQDEKEQELNQKKKELEQKLKEIDEKKQSQEIIIRKKGDKDTKITVEINGDKITINGKPLSEFKDDNITINKRKITIWDKNGAKAFDFDYSPKAFINGFDGADSWSVRGNEDPYAFLGVTTEEGEDGAKITQITKESAATKAGLELGDIITKINDKKVEGPDMLTEVVRSFKPKEEVTVYYKRNGKENSAKAILGEKKESNAMTYSFSSPEGVARAFTMPRMNVRPKIQTWDGNGDNNFELYGDLLGQRHRLGIKIQDTEDGTGVKILDVDKESPAEKAGLKKDDVVTEVGGKKVNNTDEARNELHKTQDKSTYTIRAKRNGAEMNFDIKIQKKLKTANL